VVADAVHEVRIGRLRPPAQAEISRISMSGDSGARAPHGEWVGDWH